LQKKGQTQAQKSETQLACVTFRASWVSNLELVSLGGDPRLSTDRWWEAKQEQERAAAERAAHEEKQREAKALENYQGPRWWKKERA
jgi:hypothetical protein